MRMQFADEEGELCEVAAWFCNDILIAFKSLSSVVHVFMMPTCTRDNFFQSNHFLISQNQSAKFRTIVHKIRNVQILQILHLEYLQTNSLMVR